MTTQESDIMQILGRIPSTSAINNDVVAKHNSESAAKWRIYVSLLASLSHTHVVSKVICLDDLYAPASVIQGVNAVTLTTVPSTVELLGNEY